MEYPLSYAAGAFEFTRQFFYKWTVNWRFISEETFLSKEFAIGLLAVHALLLLLFLAVQWNRYSSPLKPNSGSLADSSRLQSLRR